MFLFLRVVLCLYILFYFLVAFPCANLHERNGRNHQRHKGRSSNGRSAAERTVFSFWFVDMCTIGSAITLFGGVQGSDGILLFLSAGSRFSGFVVARAVTFHQIELIRIETVGTQKFRLSLPRHV